MKGSATRPTWSPSVIGVRSPSIRRGCHGPSQNGGRARTSDRVCGQTHLHADFVSGSRELAAVGATVVASRDGGLAFPYRPLEDGDRLDLGGVALEAIATPDTRRSTCPTYSVMAKHRSPCSPVERSCPALSRGPISSRPTRPSHSRGRSTAHSTRGSFRYQTTSRSTRPMAAVRSARLLPLTNAQRRSDARGRRMHFPSPRTRTRSWHALRTRSGPTRRTSRASGK